MDYRMDTVQVIFVAMYYQFLSSCLSSPQWTADLPLLHLLLPELPFRLLTVAYYLFVYTLSTPSLILPSPLSSFLSQLV
jgi:hypothetical protein